jgi:hypothetical protein
VDSENFSGCFFCSSVSASISTSISRNLLVAYVGTEDVKDMNGACFNMFTPPGVTSISTPGLVWHLRASATSKPTYNHHDGSCMQSHLEEWYSRPNSTLSSANITITTGEDCEMCSDSQLMLFTLGVAGMDPLSPFDHNANAFCSASGSTSKGFCDVSTIGPEDLVIGGYDCPTLVGVCFKAAGAGFTSPLFFVGFSTGAEYQAMEGAQTNLAVSWSGANPNLVPWVVIGDSIQS